MPPAMRYQRRRASLLGAAAFETFYEETMPRIYGYFLHRCGGSRFTAEELTQETFLAAVIELKRGTEVGAPIAWVFGIARHKLLDHYRREGRSARRVAEADEIADVTYDPIEDDIRERALEVLAAVPPDQRAALVLRHMDGLSVPEVAAALDRSVEATESLLARGRRQFRQLYAGGEDG